MNDQLKRINVTSSSCSGCTACLASCPRQAITMQPDMEGFPVPHINDDKCIYCGICLKVCPAAASYQFSGSQCTAYAMQNKNDKVRKNSASGALFPAFANLFINKKHGYVCGCILDEKCTPRHIVSNVWADVEKMQDSKYVQSDMGDCIEHVCELLKNGESVLFTGTSCQVAGLYAACTQKRIDTSNLLTLDFFCHGVPSPQIWHEYLLFYSKEKHRKVAGYRFRSKQYGWGVTSRGTGHLNTVEYFNSVQMSCKDNVSYAARMWRTVFFSNLTLRTYCYSCKYTTAEKPADITMGDFWGIEKVAPQFDDGKGCSLAILHNEKAERLFNELESAETLSVTLDDCIKKQANAFKPCAMPSNRNQFWQDYRENGFDFVAKKYFHYTVLKRIKDRIRRIEFNLGLKYLYGFKAK